MSSSSHPYYPLNAVLSGVTFTPNSRSVTFLISTFALAWTIILGTTLFIVRRVNPRLSLLDQAIALWFVLTGSIHLFFEGFFIYNHTHLASSNHYFAQLWKEYALSDSRYLTSDPFLLCIETSTVFILAPVSLLTALLTTIQSPYRHSFQSLVSTCHVWGNLIYLSTSILDELTSGKLYYRPEPVYFWVYFVGMNGIWMLVPGLILWNSFRTTAKAFRVEAAVVGWEEKKNQKKNL